MTPSAPSVDDLCEQAKVCLKQRDVSGALARFEEAIARNPDHIPAHEGLAAVCFARKDYDRAAELFRRLVALDPKRVEPLVNLGAVYNRQGNFQEAIKTLRTALARDRRCVEAYYNLGFAQRGNQQLSMAVSAYKEAIRLSPEMAEAYVSLGQVLLEMGNTTQAVLNFERALQLKPGIERARQGLNLARSRIEEAKKAQSPFGRLVDIEEVGRQNARSNQKLRELTPQERFEDRREVHRLAKESEQYSVAFFNQAKNELGPAVLSLARVVTEEEDPAAWVRDVEALSRAFERFQKFSKLLSRKLDELQAHEDFIAKS